MLERRRTFPRRKKFEKNLGTLEGEIDSKLLNLLFFWSLFFGTVVGRVSPETLRLQPQHADLVNVLCVLTGALTSKESLHSLYLLIKKNKKNIDSTQ